MGVHPIMLKELVSDSVIRRLPRYYRCLIEMERKGIERTSSQGLATRLGSTASQVRQDFNCFGGFGHQGYGYRVSELRAQLGKVIGLDQCKPAILIGAGHLGSVIAVNIDFSSYGFSLTGIFDSSPKLHGDVLGGLEIRPMAQLAAFCEQAHPVAAVLCIPEAAAQAVAEELVELGIKGFWNFSHCDLEVDRSCIQVENVHMGDSLMMLSHRLHQYIAEK